MKRRAGPAAAPSIGRWLVLVLVLALLATPMAPAADRAAELEALREAIERGRREVERFEREHRGLLDAVDALDRSAAALADEVAARKREARESAAELAALEERIATLEERLAQTRRAMAARAVALYKTGEIGPVQVVFAARDLRELLERGRALRLLLAHDRGLVERYRDERRALAGARDRSAALVGQRQHALEALRGRSRELAAERAAKRRLLGGLQRDRAQARSAVIELESAARALEETLARLGEVARPGRTPGPPGGFDALRGRLPRPLEAPVARAFGRSVDEQFHTQIFHKGVSFAAAPGTPVRAVAAGRVRFAGWFRGYGRMVILEHGDDYFTVSGHLDEIRVAVGDTVSSSEPIGSVGETGSLVGPRLYFEIRRGGEALDPGAWFAAR